MVGTWPVASNVRSSDDHLPAAGRSNSRAPGAERSTMIRLTVNGKAHNVDVEPDTPLLWVIREQIGLTGTKYGCGIGRCGACVVHLDGKPVHACGVPVSEVSGARITTIEGLASGSKLHRVQRAWLENDVPQCGYC